MNNQVYNNLVEIAKNEQDISGDHAKAILTDNNFQLLPLLNAAYEVRYAHFKNDVTIHIINNGQNGHCPEDCKYCCQAKSSQADIDDYPLKSDDEFLAEAKNAYEKGAHRYCMVFAGRGPSIGRTRRLAHLIKKIKNEYPLEICVSAGLLDQDKANLLKEAGLDRLNHNLNTSRENYAKICTTHTYQDRLDTLQAAKNADLKICSGLILGMEETEDEIIEVAYQLRELKAESIPVNMLIPIEGNSLKVSSKLTPEFCLRVLCLFRFLNPKAEIRVAAGREIHLRDLEVLAFYPANSLFLDGYLNTKGNLRKKTFQMLKDGGFTIKSNFDVDVLLKNEDLLDNDTTLSDNVSQTVMKNLKDLRPAQST